MAPKTSEDWLATRDWTRENWAYLVQRYGTGTWILVARQRVVAHGSEREVRKAAHTFRIQPDNQYVATMIVRLEKEFPARRIAPVIRGRGPARGLR